MTKDWITINYDRASETPDCMINDFITVDIGTFCKSTFCVMVDDEGTLVIILMIDMVLCSV